MSTSDQWQSLRRTWRISFHRGKGWVGEYIQGFGGQYWRLGTPHLRSLDAVLAAAVEHERSEAESD